MPDEKKKAPSEADAATQKIDLGKKQAENFAGTGSEKVANEPDTRESAPTESAPTESAATQEAATEKIATVPAEQPAVSEAEPQAKPTAKPTAAPRRIPPRSQSEAPAKDVAAEKKSPVPASQPVGPRKIELQQPAAKQVGPQRIAPPPTEPDKPSHKKWWAALVAAVVVIAAVAAGAYVLVDRTSVDDSPETRIRTTVESFTRALAGGDLATLRSTSCGDLAAFYRDIPDAEFADVHRVSLEQGNIPTLDSIDAIQLSDDTTAIAQVIAHTDANPNDRSPRTFDLRLEGDQWKVCS